MLNHYFKYFFLIVFILYTLVQISCKKDEIDKSPSAKLTFSSDTIIFDTVFTTVGSITQQLKIYNKNSKKIKISRIALAGGNSSDYKININGLSINSTTDIELEPNDSLYIFIAITVDPNNHNKPMIITDNLIFETNGNIQDVDLVAWGQDAIFIKPDTYIKNLPPFKIVAHENESVVWDSTKPYVIYGYAVVDSTALLTIKAGTKIYFHNNSGLWIYKGGTIKVLGTKDAVVTFQGDRLEPYYREIPGQWDRIWINESSSDNEFNYAVIKNAFIGIQAETSQQYMGNKLILNNTIIKNMTGMGIYSIFYNITGYNDVIVNCGKHILALTMGGKYNFKQCTFANYWNESIRQSQSFVFNNYNDIQSIPLDSAFFGNCILWGNNTEEFMYDKNESSLFNYYFDHCLLKTNKNILETKYYINCIKSTDKLFKNYVNNNYELDSLSTVIDKGNPAINIPFDIKGVQRDAIPDLGAYERKK